MQYANKINGIIERFTKLPYSFKGVENVTCYYEKRTDLHKKDGFLELVYPVLKDGKGYGEVKDASLSKDKTKYIMPLIDKEIIELDEFSLKDERNQKLREGVIISDIWFNEDTLNKFATYVNICKSNNKITLDWGHVTGWKTIKTAEAVKICLEASLLFSSIYKDFAAK